MKRITFIFLFLSICLISYAQDINFAWVKQTSIRRDSIYYPQRNLAIAVDAAGNVYTTGAFTGTVDFDPGPGVFNLSSGGRQDIFISKLSANGNFIWVKQMVSCGYCSGSGYSIMIDAMGNIYFSGTFYGTIDFDPGPGILNLSGLLNGSAFISKFDPVGNLLWAKQIGGASNTAGKSMRVDGSGNVYTSGVFDGIVDFDPGPGTFNLSAYGTNAFISKLNSNGDFIWAKTTQGTGYGNVVPWENVSLSLDNSGVYIAGNFWGLFDFDPGAGAFYLTSDNNNSGNVFVFKLDAAGNFVWAKQLGGYAAHGNSIASDVAGNIYMTGSFSGIADFDPGPGLFELTASATNSFFVAKLDAAGNFVWAKQSEGNGSAHGNSICLDIAGNIYATGSFSRTVDFGTGPTNYDLSTIGINGDMFVTKLDMDGDFIWAKQMGGGASSYTEGNGIAVDPSGNVYTAGEFSSMVDFDPAADEFILVSVGVSDIFVHKLTRCSNSSSSTITASTCTSYSLNGQTYSEGGIYTQQLNNVSGCDSIITLNLTMVPKSFSTLTQSICTGQTYAGYTTSGTYIDTLVAANGCDSIRTLQLTLLPKPDPRLGINRELCSGDTLILDPGQFNSYLWQDGTTNRSITVMQPGIYSVEVSDNCGTGKDEILIKEGVCDIFFPSAFTPNNDGKNDLFKALGTYNPDDFFLVVYNRWGQKIFESNDHRKGWTGFVNGQQQNTGVFVWYCEFKRPGNMNKTKMKGTVLLIK